MTRHIGVVTAPAIADGDMTSDAVRRLTRYLGDRLPDFSAPFRLHRLTGGLSCLTYRLDGDGWTCVLRRSPQGVMEPTAHSMAREYRTLITLQTMGGPVPSARPYALCEDPTIIGTSFLLMEHMPGSVIRDSLPPNITSDGDRWELGRQLVATMARLHQVSSRKAPSTTKSTTDFLGRQLHHMRSIWHPEDGPSGLAELHEWLLRHMPPARPPALIHGDYGLHNVLFRTDGPPRILAVLDWELSTWGDPLVDLGWLVYGWRERDDPRLEIPLASVTNRAGFHSRASLVEEYRRCTGSDPGDISWYIAFAGWKLAVIVTRAVARLRRYGDGHHDADRLEAAVPELVKRAHALAGNDI